MKLAANWLRHLKGRLGRMGGRAWLAVAAAAVGVVGGVVWLLASAGSADGVPAAGGQLLPEQVQRARQALSEAGIDSQLSADQLLVRPDRLAQADDALRRAGLTGTTGEPAFERVAQSQDIWSTQGQVARRWQAAKMATLGRLIGRFPAVRSASVILEEGSGGGLGGRGVEPTASVAVELCDGRQMTAELAGAIADLVSGSVAGMRRHHVRIIHGAGASIRLPEQDAAGDAALQRAWAAEAYFTRKVRESIRQIEDAVIAVEVDAQGAAPRCLAARVSVPLSYALRLGGAGEGGPLSEPALQSAIGRGLEKVRGLVVLALGAEAAPPVRVEWHADLPWRPADGPSASAAVGPGSPAGWAAACATGGVVLLGGAVLLVCARRRRGARRAAPGEGAETDGQAAAGGTDALQWASARDILELLGGEHPQTIAVVLSLLDTDRGAAVLAELPEDVRLEVSRRIAGMDRLDAQAVRQVSQTLAGRLAKKAGADRDHVGGVKRLAELLHHAGLDAGPESPRAGTAADHRPPRPWPLTFDDLSGLDPRRLREALESLDVRRLAIALRTAPPRLTEKVRSCLSRGSAARLAEQVDRIGPVRLSEVEAAQQDVLDAVEGHAAATPGGRAPLEAEAGRYVPADGGVVV